MKRIGVDWPANGWEAKTHVLYFADEQGDIRPTRYWHVWTHPGLRLGKPWKIIRFVTTKTGTKHAFAKYIYRLTGKETEAEIKQIAQTLMDLINIGESETA